MIVYIYMLDHAAGTHASHVLLISAESAEEFVDNMIGTPRKLLGIADISNQFLFLSWSPHHKHVSLYLYCNEGETSANTNRILTQDLAASLNAYILHINLLSPSFNFKFYSDCSRKAKHKMIFNFSTVAFYINPPMNGVIDIPQLECTHLVQHNLVWMVSYYHYTRFQIIIAVCRAHLLSIMHQTVSN